MSSSTGKAVLWLIVVSVLTGGVATWHFWPEAEPPREPSRVDVSGMEPQVAAAISSMRDRVLKSPDDADAWGRFGMVLVAHNLWTPSLECFDEAGKLDPNNPRWPYFVALVRKRNDPLPSIVPILERVVELTGSTPDAPRLMLADLLLELNAEARARVHYQKLIEKNPAHPRAWLGLARLSFAKGDFAECASQLDKTLSSPFTRKEGHVLLAQAQARLGISDAAARTSEQAEKLPKDEDWPDEFTAELAGMTLATQVILDEYRKLDKAEAYQEAQRLLDSIESTHPYLHSILVGVIHLERGRVAQAESALENARSADPNKAEPFFYLGELRLHQKRYQDAIGLFEESRKRDESDFDSLTRLGECYAALDQTDKAIENYRLAVRYLPHRAEVRLALGRLLMKAGQKDEAAAEFRHVLQVDPDNEEAKGELRKLELDSE